MNLCVCLPKCGLFSKETQEAGNSSGPRGGKLGLGNMAQEAQYKGQAAMTAWRHGAADVWPWCQAGNRVWGGGGPLSSSQLLPAPPPPESHLGCSQFFQICKRSLKSEFSSAISFDCQTLAHFRFQDITSLTDMLLKSVKRASPVAVKKKFVCRCKRHEFDPWSRKIPHAEGQLGATEQLLKPTQSP